MEVLFKNLTDQSIPSFPPVFRKQKQQLAQNDIVLTESNAYNFAHKTVEPSLSLSREHSNLSRNDSLTRINQLDSSVDQFQQEWKPITRSLFSNEDRALLLEKQHIQSEYYYVTDEVPHSKDPLAPHIYFDFEDSQLNPQRPSNDATHVKRALDQLILKQREKSNIVQPTNVAKAAPQTVVQRQKMAHNYDIYVKPQNERKRNTFVSLFIWITAFILYIFGYRNKRTD
ncbi:hypothetical protein AKO1_001287 [Acrasis kona]|uniref:Uncharacterized protein n=1 Tax=Acrasis kona TaxID=1008807 RepID=A0AAW2ZDK3_9EUKA